MAVPDDEPNLSGSPRLAIHLLGEHSETRTRTETSTDVEGTTTSRTEDYTETVTDFGFHVDVSNLALPQWSRIGTQASRDRSGRPRCVRRSRSTRAAGKEFRVEKLVLWDYDRVATLLTDLVRSSPGHGIHVRVEFPKQDWKVSAFASNRCLRAANSALVQVLCVVSCLGRVFACVGDCSEADEE